MNLICRLLTFLTHCKQSILGLSNLLFVIFPTQNKTVLLESHKGLSISCNPKAIFDQIAATYPSFRIIWVYNKSPHPINLNVTQVKRCSLRYFYFLSTSQFLINNGEFPRRIRFKQNQTYINTQHGTPLKKMGTDIKSHSFSSRRKTRNWTYLISPNTYTTNIFRRVFNYTGQVLEVGYPRNDILINNRDFHSKHQEFKRKYNIPLDKKVILYAPTYRDNQTGNSYPTINFNRLHQIFGQDYIFLLRIHHLANPFKNTVATVPDSVVDCSSSEFDIQELMLISDVLITDYSSVMFDYSILCRPIIFYLYDYEEYKNDIRGLYFDLINSSPGPVVKNMSELCYTLNNIEELNKSYKQKIDSFYTKFCSLESGNASQLVIENIISPFLNSDN